VRGPLNAALAAILAAVLVAGCGSSGSGSKSDSGSAEAPKVAQTLRTAFSSRSSSVCTLLATQRFLDQVETADGAAAVRECVRNQATLQLARSVTVSKIEVDGERASAHMAISGGDNDGLAADLELVKPGGRWKMDRLRAAQIDLERYLAATRRKVTRAPLSLDPAATDCTIRGLRAVGGTAIANATVSGDHAVATNVLKRCASDAVRRLIDREVRTPLIRSGATAAQVSCAVAAERKIMGPAELDQIFSQDASGTAELNRRIAAATRACLTRPSP
jgi:hypothetical protein